MWIRKGESDDLVGIFGEGDATINSAISRYFIFMQPHT